MRPLSFKRRRAARPAPTAPLVLDGSFHWESPEYRQRRADRVQERRRDVDAMVAERAEHHPRARAAYDDRIAGSTASWHTEDTDEHAEALGRLRDMRVRAEVGRAGSVKALHAARDEHELATANWRESYLRLGGYLPDEPVGPPLPEPDGRALPPVGPPVPDHEPAEIEGGWDKTRAAPDPADWTVDDEDEWWSGPAPGVPDDDTDDDADGPHFHKSAPGDAEPPAPPTGEDR